MLTMGWEMLKPMVMTNQRGDYLFYQYCNGNIFFTLIDEKGEILKSDELLISLDSFVKSIKKMGYKPIGDGDPI
jgi:hypothetical protein